MADTPVWEDQDYNEDVNQWDPNASDLQTWGEAEPSHGDVPAATPMSEQYGQVDGGSVPDARANLLTDVRSAGQLAPPTQVIRHEVVTTEAGAELVRARVMVVTGTTPTTLLEENPNRKRAYVSVQSAGKAIMLTPLRQGTPPPLTGGAIATGAYFPLAQTDARLKVETQAGVDAYAATPADTILVAVWEELDQPDGWPGLT